MAADWSIQAPREEGAPFLLYRGVMVGRLYGGAPTTEMLRLLNAEAHTRWDTCTECGGDIFTHTAWSHEGGTPPQDHPATPQGQT